MFTVIYRPVNEGDIWQQFGPFDSKDEATEYAKTNYRTGTLARRPWVIVPVQPVPADAEV